MEFDPDDELKSREKWVMCDAKGERARIDVSECRECQRLIHICCIAGQPELSARRSAFKFPGGGTHFFRPFGGARDGAGEVSVSLSPFRPNRCHIYISYCYHYNHTTQTASSFRFMFLCSTQITWSSGPPLRNHMPVLVT